MPAQLKRVSEEIADIVTEMAEREQRTFVAQLDIVAKAGLEALGKAPTPAPTRTPRKRAATKTTAKATATT